MYNFLLGWEDSAYGGMKIYTIRTTPSFHHHQPPPPYFTATLEPARTHIQPRNQTSTTASKENDDTPTCRRAPHS